MIDMNSEPTSENSHSDDSILLMPNNSKYAGQKIDTSSRRSIQIESEIIATVNQPFTQHKTVSPQTTHLIVNYFYHHDNFWRAKIPLDGVKEVLGQSFNFSQIKTKQGQNGVEKQFHKNGLPKRKIKSLNHVQSRIKFMPDQPVELFAMDDSDCNSAVYKIHDIVYSLEAIGPLGVSYNLVDGLQGNLIAAHRFFSTEEMVFERIVVQNQYVSEIAIPNLNDLHRRDLLIKSLLRSHKAGMSENYYLYRICGTNNCTSSPFQILDSVVDYGFLQRIGALLYRFPFSPIFYLRVRGLAPSSTKQSLVRDEFQSYIQKTDTQNRKRDYVKNKNQEKRAIKKKMRTE